MKNFMKYGLLIMIKLTAAGRPCDREEPVTNNHNKIAGNSPKCNPDSNDFNHCLWSSSYRHHSYYSCIVCTTPNCENGKINCGKESRTKELHWSFDVFDVGFYTYSLSKFGFIKIVLNNKLYNKIELSYERERRKITIKLKECTDTNKKKEDCIENRSEVHENLDPKHSCIFVAIGYQNASTINFVSIHNCSRVATSYVGYKNVYSLKRPIENFVQRSIKKITIQFDYDKENIFDGVPIILPCGSGGYIYDNKKAIHCKYLFPEPNNSQGFAYYMHFYQDDLDNMLQQNYYWPQNKYKSPLYFDENGMKYTDSMMKLLLNSSFEKNDFDAWEGCLKIKTTSTTSTTTTTTSTTSTSTTSTSTTSTVTELQTNLTSTTEETLKPDLTTTTVEALLPDVVIPTVSLGEFNPPVIEKVQVTLPPLPVITIGKATLIRNTSGLNKLNLTAFMKAVGTDSLHPSYLLSEMNPNNFLIPLKNNSLVDVSQYQLSSPQKVKPKKKSSSQAGATDTFSSGTKSLVIILNKCNLLILFLKFL